MDNNGSKGFSFPESAPTANPVFYRTYSRRVEGRRETPEEVFDRTTRGLTELGKLTEEESSLILQMQNEMKALPSGRWLWVGGTEWIKKPENYYGAYNCSSTKIVDWKAFALMMNLAMQGCGTGAMLEDRFISQLPVIRNKINLNVKGQPGDVAKSDRLEDTTIIQMLLNEDDRIVDRLIINVGDSRSGWVSAYETVLEHSSKELDSGLRELDVWIDISNIRPEGEELKGFGGIANPALLGDMFPKIAAILNGAIGRKLTAKECCLLIDEAAKVVVAGSIRRSAGMRQFNETDPVYKLNLWVEGEDGQWRIDPERDAMRMANHTRVYHHKPTEQECIDAVRLQFQSGEGAIQYAPEAIARASVDLLSTAEDKINFLRLYSQGEFEAGKGYLNAMSECSLSPEELDYRMNNYGLNPLTLAA